MKTRQFGNTGKSLSEIGLGCWQLGGDWGHVDDDKAFEILQTAVQHHVTFIDTADVYGGGRSEELIGKFIKQRREDLFIATKVGRFNYPGPYTAELLKQHITDSLNRLGVDALDLVQLHCIPTEVMAAGEVFDWLRDLKQEGLIKHFGASVESMEEGLLVLDQEDLTSLQIIFNIFRQKPIHTLLDKAKHKNVGIIARLPLASGLLTGKFSTDTSFDESDHRNYNKDGDAFNVGETFAGLQFTTGVALADRIKPMVPDTMTMAQFSQRWILDHEAVSTVITGASSPTQVADNTAVSEISPLPQETHEQLAELYTTAIHDHIRGTY
ncbi:MAG: aryl-alcohol dehydrogenase-like predicted oxidoreductase [Pirellulaceae bacterium]|jgi:aryl-alcohol dehydrogenase-like predicted oxidoreductase